MKVAFTFASTPPRHRNATNLQALLEERRGSWVQDIPEWVAQQGLDVSVHIIYPQHGELMYNGVRWYFCTPTITSNFLRNGKELSISFFSTLVRRKPDIIHFQRIGYALNFSWVTMLAQLLKIPIVAQDRGERSDMFRRGPIVGLPLRIGFQLADRVIFFTNEQLQRYCGIFKIPRPCVIFNGYSEHFRKIDKSIARKQTDMSGDPVLLWVGIYHPHKDPMTLLRAFNKISRRFPSARLYMFGGGILEQKMKDYTKRNDVLKHSVKIKPFVPNTDLPAIYNSADVYILASRWEGMARSPLEAMACGTVPVLSDYPSFRFTTNEGEYGLHFPIGDDNALERCLAWLIENPIQRQELANKAAKWISSNFTWEHTARKLVRLYSEVIQEKKGDVN
jgi:glycosyltransferase involved in cell wall biosynthesis